MARRILRWPSLPETPPPRHPYRDSAILHAALAGIIVLIAWSTNGDVGKAAIVAVGYFVLAVGWSWWRFRERLKRADEESRR